jgi:hypothetical protein
MGKNNARSYKWRQEKQQDDRVVVAKIKYCGFAIQFIALK